ncbi:serine/threonine protein kinase [bacterium]|nr:serine/threonine protein kinase [bacterium]
MADRTIGGCEITREIGRGGMGVVYEAQQLSPRRTVALKILPPEWARVPQIARRFENEASRMAALEEHAGIATVYLAGDDQGVPYIAMQYLPGGDLGQRLLQGWRPSLPEIVAVIAEVAEALDFAHQRGVIHRDIKPANIMLDAVGRPVVTDFGIARAVDEIGATMTGSAAMTPEYASPEQIKGNPLDGRSDLYSLGVVLYQLVCGQPPFQAPTAMALALKHISEPPPSPRVCCPNLPVILEEIILRCLAKEPHQRFATGQALAQALRLVSLPAPAVSLHTPTPAPVVVPVPPPPPPQARSTPAVVPPPVAPPRAAPAPAAAPAPPTVVPPMAPPPAAADTPAVSAMPETVVVPKQSEQSPSAEETGRRPRARRPWVYVCIAIVCLGALGAGAVALKGRLTPPPTPAQTAPQTSAKPEGTAPTKGQGTLGETETQPGATKTPVTSPPAAAPTAKPSAGKAPAQEPAPKSSVARRPRAAGSRRTGSRHTGSRHTGSRHTGSRTGPSGGSGGGEPGFH